MASEKTSDKAVSAGDSDDEVINREQQTVVTVATAIITQLFVRAQVAVSAYHPRDYDF